ncbi:MAG: RsmB/NOP family class I SAM-dependent RNA methyltransferase [Pararhodobacter sp.]
MTPAARAAAAIDILDRWLAGEPAEAALTRWARASRFAGSGDREAVRDLVYDVIRKRRSAQALGGGVASGRALLLGCLRAAAAAMPAARLPATPLDWDGTGHAPPALDATERALFAAPPPELPRAVALDCPDWLLPAFDSALGLDADPVLRVLRDRAPVFLRVNADKSTPEALCRLLADSGIAAQPHPLARMALQVTAGARRLRGTQAFRDGLFEMQDAASQAVAARFAQALPVGTHVLDYCAGGGGKALALAASGLSVSAHDADPGRMRDLPARATRAGVAVAVLADPAGQAPWPALLADVPCSGSGSWRRAPEAKWALSPDALARLTATQDAILRRAAALVAPGGLLGYATCSLLGVENDDRIAAFLAEVPGWARIDRLRLTPLDGGDGFFLTILVRR